MRTIRQTLFTTLLGAIVLTLGATVGFAQYGTGDSNTRELIRRIQTRTDTLQQSVQTASDRGNYRADDLSRLINDFEASVNQLDRRLTTRRGANTDARTVVDRAIAIDSFLNSNRVGAGSQRDWRAIRTDLDQLASIYNITPQWSNASSGSTGGGYGNYNLSDLQMRQLIQRVETATTNFSRTLRLDLTRNFRDRNSNTQVTQQLSTFETSVTQLRNRFNTRQAASGDVESVLQSASYLNSYVMDRQLSNQTESNWNLLKPDLDRLASAFNVSWNWTNVPGNNGGGGGYGSSADLTGTYSLNSSQGDNVRSAIDAATRNLSLAERQRVSEALTRRLESPSMLSIDRRGNNVTIASTRAPQINFVADGREQVETANGRTIKVRATLSGDALTIVRDGDRANDFSVTFDSENNGRQLLVTRTLYSERLTQPVTVRSYYDRTSDTAQLDIYDGRDDTSSGNGSGTFVIPNNTQLVAVLNSNLSTQTARENDRFTLTVRSPGQYDGATIEGYVASINRGGRVTGRSEMTLDFDTIRLRDGRSYRFAGILDSVRLPTGEVVKIDNEGAVRDSDQTNKTVTRTAIGTAVGAIIGAIAGGGKGAAIGAVVGAGAGAGSVYVQGRNDLDLTSGTEITIKSTGPRG